MSATTPCTSASPACSAGATNTGAWSTACGAPENGSRYWVTSRPLPELQAVVPIQLVTIRRTAASGSALLLIAMGAVWFAMADWINTSMAAHNAESIGALVSRSASSTDPAHRIELHTDDEFGRGLSRSTKCSRSSPELNSRNTELIQLNARIEMQQLMAQMNPHFLYNTLEIIRSFLSFDPDTSKQLIVSLTEILRYSVDAPRQEVRSLPRTWSISINT